MAEARGPPCCSCDAAIKADVAMVELYDMITLVTQSCVSLLEPKLQVWQLRWALT